VIPSWLAIRLEDGPAHKKLNSNPFSVTGGLLQIAAASWTGSFVELAFQTQSGPVRGMAEILSPMRTPIHWRAATVSGLSRLRMMTIAACAHRWITWPIAVCWGLKSSVFVVPEDDLGSALGKSFAGCVLRRSINRNPLGTKGLPQA